MVIYLRNLKNCFPSEQTNQLANNFQEFQNDPKWVNYSMLRGTGLDHANEGGVDSH